MTSRLVVNVVPMAAVHMVWDKVEAHLRNGLAWAGDDYTLDQVKMKLALGEWVLLVAADTEVQGAAAVNVYNMANFRVAFIVSIGGQFITNDDTFAQLCDVVKSFGATRIRGVARDSVARLSAKYGFKTKYSLIEAQL